MKRGLITWDKAQLPPAVFDARLAAIQQQIVAYDVPALVVYSDVWRSNDVRYVSNYMPYWNRAFTVIPRGEKPILLCSLSPRVYPWIKSVTIHEVIVPSPSLPAQLMKLCAERGWTKVAICDRAALPYDLDTQLTAEKIELIDMARGALRPAATESEISMHRRAAQLARRVLEEQITGQAIGLTDYELAGQLERRLRRAGAEDVVLLFSNGRTVPRPAAGDVIGEYASATVSLELNGHWAKLSRNVAGIASPMPPAATATVHVETLSGPYAWEGIDDLAAAHDAIVSLHVEIERDGNRLHYGDTCLQGRGHLDVL